MLYEGNEEAFELWLICLTQWRVGMMGAVGLDYVAVFEVAKCLGIEVDQAMLRKIQCLEAYTLRSSVLKHETEKSKPCKHIDACAMCSKQCNERINAWGTGAQG